MRFWTVRVTWSVGWDLRSKVVQRRVVWTESEVKYLLFNFTTVKESDDGDDSHTDYSERQKDEYDDGEPSKERKALLAVFKKVSFVWQVAKKAFREAV